MLGASQKQAADEWSRAQATIIACKQTFLGIESFSNEGYSPAEYVVTFCYMVNGRTFKGTYRANSLQECGHTFEILYDPQNPSRNSGSDILQKSWVRITAGILGGISALMAIWLWGNKSWF
jgi:hypothetical protein